MLKEKIHQLVDACDDNSALQEIESVLQQTVNGQDWWQLLPDVEKQKTLISLEQSAKGQTFSHKEIMEKVWAKFTK